jgi:2-(1,2-epoxy-1,2-dihydrophenyl)acetyl-CoA isomerase
MTESVLYHASEGVATITLNRPELLNALSREMLESLREAIERAAQGVTVRAVVLTGAGRGFFVRCRLGRRDACRSRQGTG